MILDIEGYYQYTCMYWKVEFETLCEKYSFGRENLFEEMLQEREDVAVKRKRCKEVLHVLQQAARVRKLQS